MNTTKRAEWCSLPNELLNVIGERLDNRVDVLRFRAVCTSWRSSLRPFHRNSPVFPIYVHVPKPSDPRWRFRYTYLNEKTVYRLEPLDQDNNDSNNSETSKGWLVTVEETKSGRCHLLNPLSHHRISYKPATFPKKLNLLDYRVFALSTAYWLDNGDHVAVHKAIFSASDSTVLVIRNGGKLAFLRLRYNKWTDLDDQRWGTDSNYYVDIMLYKGKFYAIDNCGQVVVIDSSTLTMTKVWPRLCASGNLQFVQSSGDIYVIANRREYDVDNCPKIWIFKLDGASWVEVKSLEDRVAFLGEDCSFFASAEQLAGCKGNCIYFTHTENFPSEENGYNTRVFNLVDRTLSLQSDGPTNFQLFWPPPTWLREAK